MLPPARLPRLPARRIPPVLPLLPLALTSALLGWGCAATPKAVCTVIDLASDACGAFVSVKMPDGTVVRVPKTEVRAAAQRSVELGTNGR